MTLSLRLYIVEWLGVTVNWKGYERKLSLGFKHLPEETKGKYDTRELMPHLKFEWGSLRM
jgi:hypothetical protein